MHYPPMHNSLEAQIERLATRLAELRDEARDMADAFAPGDIDRERYRERAMTYSAALHDLACYTEGRFGERNDAKAQAGMRVAS